MANEVVDEMIFPKDKPYPKGGTCRRIIKWLIDENKDKEVLERFIASFPQVMEPQLVWKLIYGRLIAIPAAKETALRDKLINFIWIWVERDLTRDFLSKDRDMYIQLLEFLDKLTKEDLEMSKRFKLMVVKSGKKKITREQKKIKMRRASHELLGQIATEPTASPKRMTHNNRILSATKLPLTDSLRPALSPVRDAMGDKREIKQLTSLEPGRFEFHDLEPDLVASQLTLIEFEMFSAIADSELLHMGWKNENPRRKQEAENIIKMVDRFNLVSYWVATEIVMQPELKQREKTVRKFIQVAENLRDLNNYNGVMEIIGGLNLWSVTRLKQTWTEVGAIQAVIQKLNELMESKQNYRNYRASLKTARAPLIPYLGVCLRDLQFTEDGNPDWIGPKDQGILNFEKLMLLGDTILQVRQFQESVYQFQYDPVIQDFLSKLLTLPEEMLAKHSMLCEPSKLDG